MKNIRTRLVKAAVALAAVGGLTLGVATAAEAASYTKNSYCTGLNSSIDVRTSSRAALSVNAYSLRDGRYLGSKTGTGTRLYWAPGYKSGYGEDVKFVVTTGVSAKSVTTACTVNNGTFFVTG